MKKFFYFILISIILFSSTLQHAKETLIYADSITYDEDSNLIARGNVKIISKDELITSQLVIIKEKDKKIILPKEFQYKDNDNNYYYGSSGEFTSDFEEANIKDIKLQLNDGSRIVGTEAFKKGKMDLINKAAFSPCTSKIEVKDFICPIWQVEGEKILHDRENLFLHQKHSKLRFINLPVFYFPYMISPSPLRKQRKSGFLNPKINLNFLDTKTSQSTSLPYYFAISEDKELLFTPTINYGGGVDASQRLKADYAQVISGGFLTFNLATDTNLENQNNESWIRDASFITNSEKNINEKFKMNFNSAFQSSPTYLRRTDQNNFLNRKSTLNTSINLNGYNLNKIDDKFEGTISGYQVVRNNEDNKKTPTALPYIKYSYGTQYYKNTKYIQKMSFYNIFRDTATDDHAQRQQKIYYDISTNYETIKFHSKINFKTELINQFYNIENKKIGNEDFSGTYSRIFPMTGLYFETPFINYNNNLKITPKVSFILNGSQASSNKVSNEDSTNNSYSLLNNTDLTRYTGSDAVDNSKRVNYGLGLTKDLFNFSVSQSYEFTDYSTYHKDTGQADYMTDLLSAASYGGAKNILNHEMRYNVDQGKIKSQGLTFENDSKIGVSEIKYTQERKENNFILEDSTENLTLEFGSKKFFNYSSVNLKSTFDLMEDEPTKYILGYKYFDECFGIRVDFDRSYYEDRDLKPYDNLTILFAFKHLGAYKSTNIAESISESTNIKWNEVDVLDYGNFN